MTTLSRRRFIIGAATTVGAPAILNSGNICAPAFAQKTSDELIRPPSPLIKRVVRSPTNTYFTYPHSNGFLPDGRAVLASTPKTGPGLDFIAFDPRTGGVEHLAYVRDTRMYYSIAENGLMLVSQKEGAAVVDLGVKNPQPRTILHEPNWTTSADNDISPDGKWALLTRSRYLAPQNYRCDMVEIATGRIKNVAAPGWPMDHAHFSPYDPSWIAYCANRNGRDPQRMWVWNEERAPRGRNIFRQQQLSGKFFHIGHERAMFHKPAMLVVAYGTSSAMPRGLYEVEFNGNVRLISESNGDLHCNISRDGRWAVVSLQGKYDLMDTRPTPDWLNSEGKYGFTDVAIVSMRTGARFFLYRGTNSAKGQPYEAQPTISPDGLWVLLKDAREQCVIFLEISRENLIKSI
ncbi:hypothetical protein [Hyphomicrobium sp. 2TAF46]|uniref:hypothetical protein n=1 Tax=Hyphomicrobium sp. 2TAF46 TaxID=3233019 RepID=UPI003F8F6017